MILQHTTDGAYVLFNPEDLKERKKLDSFPGLLKQGLQYYAPSKQHVIYNLFHRLKRKIKIIKTTPEVREMIEGEIVIKQLPADFKFHTQPLKHQLVALRFAYTFGCFLNLSEPGLGKTKVTLDYIWLIKAKKSLIVCPKSLLFVWEEETIKHRPELRTYVIKTTDWEKEQTKILDADVVVINYDKAVALEEQLLELQFDFIAVDEGLIKNPKTDRTKAITKIGHKIPNRCVMSGTLVNNSPLDTWAPLHFVEPALVGGSFYKYREEYALVSRHNRFITVGFRNVEEIKDTIACCSVIMTKAEWLTSLPPKEFKHIYVQMGDRQREAYLQLSNNYLLQIKEEGIEVEVDNPLSVLIKLNQISNGFVYYKENIEESLDELFGKESKKRSKDTRKVFFFEDQPKAEALIRLIESDDFNDLAPQFGNNDKGKIYDTGKGDPTRTNSRVSIGGSIDRDGENSRSKFVSTESGKSSDTCIGGHRQNSGKRAIIWYNLSAERTIIEQVLTRAGIPFLVVAGGENDIGGVVNKFNKDPSFRFLLCQAKTINYGVTIMGTAEEDLDLNIVPEFDPLVSDEIFFSINFSLELFLQQQDRIHRIGQTRPCKYWLILSNSKIERKIADRLEEKLICNRQILVDIINTLDSDFEES